MHKPLFLVTAAGVAAAGGLIFASALPAGAATAGLAQNPLCTTGPGDPVGTVCIPPATTPVTFTITSVGTLSITVPTATVSLGSEAAPGTDGATTLSSGSGDDGSTDFGNVTVIDNRSLDPADWTATVSSTDFTTTPVLGGPTDTIVAADAYYDTNGVAGAGAGFANGDIADVTAGLASPLNLSTTAQPVVSETGFDGDNGATWDPTITVLIPAHAVVGVYNGTVTHSVS
jgi:hypothetical protein